MVCLACYQSMLDICVEEADGADMLKKGLLGMAAEDGESLELQQVVAKLSASGWSLDEVGVFSFGMHVAWMYLHTC